MNLQFDKSVAVNYKSASQKIRIISEHWLTQNLFCPCCVNIHIDKLPNNSPVADARCENCGEVFELKSKKISIGAKTIIPKCKAGGLGWLQYLVSKNS